MNRRLKTFPRETGTHHRSERRIMGMRKRSLLLAVAVLLGVLGGCGQAERLRVPEMSKSRTQTEASSSAIEDELEMRRSELEAQMREAVDQYRREDHTPLEEPVRYRFLWIGFSHVTFGELDFRMTDFDREYLRAVALNFEKTVERLTEHNLDVEIDLFFEEDPYELTRSDEEDWLYLARETAQPAIDRYGSECRYDTVLTAVQTEGDENRLRNLGRPGAGTYGAILGLATGGIQDDMGYSTFNLSEPKQGTWPLKDPEIPSLYATAVAVHEWLHQLEAIGDILGIDYPDTHAASGEPEFPGYRACICDENDYDFFEFYAQVLQGRVPYTENGTVRLVGMYPKMWSLVRRGALELGAFTISDPSGARFLSAREEEPCLTVLNEPCRWILRYELGGRYVLSPEAAPVFRIDLSNAWDVDGNTIGLCPWTGYEEAQSWFLTQNADGTYCIRTAYGSGRALTAAGNGDAVTLETAIMPEDAQCWRIEPVRTAGQ